MTLPLRGLGTVFVRELRSQSRTPATWCWRWWTVLALLGTLTFSMIGSPLASNAAVGLALYRTLAGSLILTTLVSWGIPMLLVTGMAYDGTGVRELKGCDVFASIWILCMGEIGRRVATSLIAGRRYTAG